jgi:hypothetical protein
MRALAAAAVFAAVSVVGWPTAPAAVAVPAMCASLSGIIDGSQTCQIRRTEAAYSLNISFPVDYPDQQSISDYVAQTRDGFVNVAKSPGSQDKPYELDTTATKYSSSTPSRSTQSIVFKTFQDVGGARPQTFYKSFNWDLGARKPITIESLFAPGTQPFPVILPIVQGELIRQSGVPVLIPQGVGLDPNTYQNFAITNDSLIFFFGQGEVLPESAGALQVTVPRATIDSMLA